MDTFCKDQYCHLLSNNGKRDEYSMPYCKQDEHPCNQDINGKCRIYPEGINNNNA